MKLTTAEEAAKLVKDGDTVVCSGFMLSTVAEEMYSALEKRFLETSSPKNLTIMCGAGVGDLRPEVDLGLDHFAHEGLLKRVIAGHYGSNHRITKMINENRIESYNWPQGVISHVVRAVGNGQKGYLTKIGMKTYMDPRLEGAKMNDITKEDLIEVVDLLGEEYLYYKAPKVDVALIRGTTADEDGNVSFEDEIAYSMARVSAMAAKACGGKVIVQVKNYVKSGQIDPRMVQVAGIFVDAIIITQDLDRNHRQTPGSFHNDALCGQFKVTTSSVRPLKMSAKKIIGRRAAMELIPHSVVNLGIGVPETVSAVAAEEGCSDQMVMTVEAGAIGGIPAGGWDFGASINPWALVEEPVQFDFYHSGGLDVTFLGLAEVNKLGSVNVSKFGTKITGCGGFIDISQSTKKVVFCGTFTAGGLDLGIKDSALSVITEGRAKKFKGDLQQVTFSGEFAVETKQEVLFITERAVFELVEGGLKLIEIAPGIDLQKDVLDQMEFDPIISEDLKLMDTKLFIEEPIGLKTHLEAMTK